VRSELGFDQLNRGLQEADVLKTRIVVESLGDVVAKVDLFEIFEGGLESRGIRKVGRLLWEIFERFLGRFLWEIFLRILKNLVEGIFLFGFLKDFDDLRRFYFERFYFGRLGSLHRKLLQVGFPNVSVGEENVIPEPDLFVDREGSDGWKAKATTERGFGHERI